MSDEQMDPIELAAEYSEDPFDDVVETGDFNENGEPTESIESSAADSDDGSGDSIDDSGEDSDKSSEGSEDSSEESQLDDDESTKPDEEEAEELGEGKEEQDEPEAESEESEEIDYQARVDEFNKQLEEGSLEVQINDEESVLLKDLKNDYIGQKEISRRFTEYDQKSKQLDADTTEINEYINEFASKLKDGDSIGAMQYFGNFAGVAPFMIKEQLIAALRPEIIRREQMSATEVQNEYLNNQNEYLQKQRETEAISREQEQASMEFENSIKAIREANNIDEQTWETTVSELSETYKDEELTPELVAGAIKYDRMYDQADQVVKSFGEEIQDSEQWIEQLVDVKEKYPDFTEEDLKEVLTTALNTVKSDSIEQKLTKKVAAKKAPTKKQTKPTDHEDVDPELEDWL